MMLTAETFGHADDFAQRSASSSFPTTLDSVKLNCSRVNADGSPSQRWGHSSNVLNATMYIIGGYTGTENTSNSTWRYLNDINQFSCDTCKWQPSTMAASTMIPPPAVRSNHVACTVGNRYIVVIGGSGKERADQSTVRYGDLHILDTNPSSFGWMLCEVKSTHGASKALTPRTYHAGCALPGGVVAVFGGFTGTVDVQDVVLVSMNQVLRRFDNEDGVVMRPTVNVVCGTLSSVMAPRPSVRRFHTLESIDYGRAGVVFGGCAGKNYDCLNDTWVLRHTPKSTNISWSEVATTGLKPSKRWGHTATVVGRHMIVVGGRSKLDIMDCHVLTFADASLASAAWSNPQIDGIQPSPRRRHTMCSSGNKIFLFGGFDGKKFLNDVHAFQLPFQICSDIDSMKNNDSETNNMPIKSRSAEAASRRLSVSEAFAFVDGENATINRKLGHDRKTMNTPPPAPANPFDALLPPAPPSQHTQNKGKLLSEKKVVTNDSESMNCIVCKDGYKLDGLALHDQNLVRFFIPYFAVLNQEVVRQQLARVKAELSDDKLKEHIVRRLLPTAICLTQGKATAETLLHEFVATEGIQQTLGLTLPGNEGVLVEKIRQFGEAKSLISSNSNTKKVEGIVDEESLIQYANTKQWDRVHDGVLEQMKQIGYRDVQVYKCYWYVFRILNKKVEMDTLLDNIEIAAQMDITELFKGVSPDQVGFDHGAQALRTSSNSGKPTAKGAFSTSYAAAQQIREQEIKINAMEEVLEEVLTCCITQEIMINPVATLDGNVYERKQIEEWLRKSGGTDPLTRKKVKLNELIPLRNIRSAAEKFRKMQK